jgi:hypothetical protein
MNAASAALQKLALRMPGNAQTPQILSPVNVAALEFRAGQAQIGREAIKVFFGQVDETLLFAAFRTAGLAFESHAMRRPAGATCRSL